MVRSDACRPSYLATLDADRLAALLRRRPDVLVDPAPRTVDELAMRLNGVDSLTRALKLTLAA